MINRNLLPHRRVLAFSGEDRLSFLQGLITNDVRTLAQTGILWSGFLTPQGRLLNEFFLFSTQNTILMDVACDQAETLIGALNRFRLRADVQIAPTPFQVVVGTEGEKTPEDCLLLQKDPRCEGAGWRAVVEPDARPAATTVEPAAFLQRRLMLGLPDSSDFAGGKLLALEANMDLLYGVSWEKGCYMGQELTARTHYRGLVKKRLLPVRLAEGRFPDEGGAVVMDGQEVGVLLSRHGDRGLALLRREAWNAGTLSCDGRALSLCWPDWFPVEMRS